MECGTRLFFDIDRVVCLAVVQGPPENCLCQNDPGGHSGATFIVVAFRMEDHEHLKSVIHI